ncbi:TonB-dependent receptor [Prevotella sp. 10(H)]|uniref:TonB-dependent receptor n=1 Tax=Prevotella sp. 10(H) TaxID=1158294 RepID=UPI0004A74217|nr:TonB-dependent receptor [Prevotella sp. 10(H)]
MLKHIYIAIALFAVAGCCFAQKTPKEIVKGNVKTTDGKPAEFISVSLKGTIFGGITDEHGNFEFEAPAGDYTLVAYSISAHKKEYPANIKRGVSNYFSDLTIIENKNQLEEVVVTGQFSPQSLRNSLYKVRVINNQTIQQKASTDIKSLLNTEVGIRISNDMTLGESNFEMMGMSGNNVKVLLDGVPLVDRGATKQSLSQIDINTIEQIEIVEGPMSVIYGTDALAGVINIITKKARVLSDRNTYSVSARIQEESVGDEYEFFDGKGIHNENINIALASKTGLYVNGGYTRNVTDGWKGDKTGREKTWPPKDQFYYEGMLGFKKKGFHAWYRLNYLDESIFTPINPNPENVMSDRNFLTDRYTHNFQADWKLNNRLGLNVVSSYQDYKRKTRTIITDLNTGQKSLSTEESAQDVSKYKAIFARATAAWTFSPELSFQPGIEYNKDEGSGSRIKNNSEISTFAAFLSAEWKPYEWFSVRPGVRTIIDADYDAPVAIPSVGTKFSLNHDMDLRLSYAYGFRAPTLQELFFSFNNANHDVEGNPDLKAEYSTNFTGSYTWRILHNENIRVTSTLSAFYNDFRDRIVLAQGNRSAIHRIYSNVDKYKTTGGTFENSMIWKNLQANVSFSLVGRYNSLTENDELKNENLPTFRFSPELSTSISYQIVKTGTNLNFYYKFTGKRNEYSYDTDTKELYLTGLDAYHMADFTASQNLGKYLILNAGVKNLFDLTTVDNTATSGGHTSSGSSTLMGCGRSFFIGINFLLNN